MAFSWKSELIDVVCLKNNIDINQIMFNN